LASRPSVQKFTLLHASCEKRGFWGEEFLIFQQKIKNPSPQTPIFSRQRRRFQNVYGFKAIVFKLILHLLVGYLHITIFAFQLKV